MTGALIFRANPGRNMLKDSGILVMNIGQVSLYSFRVIANTKQTLNKIFQRNEFEMNPIKKSDSANVTCLFYFCNKKNSKKGKI